ncbi:MAG: PfkB family carbohydrate kinase [Elusimicrobia bacterium]|nr:PfkB family carbohydrate kinase [Elusimicrobiota bacterium]
MKFQRKIKSVSEIKGIVKSLKNAGKKTILSVGIFDIIHPGIIAHLKKAKKHGDILIVGVIKNEDVKRGPERPIFSEVLRLDNVAAIGFVDYVCLVEDKKPFESVRQIKPNIFAKGESFKERDKKTLKKLESEEKLIKNAGCSIYVTENVNSSTSIINQFLDLYSRKTKKYLAKMKNKYGAAFIVEQLKSLKDMKVLVIGDGIIDEYIYCESMGKSSKEPLVVNRFLSSEAFAGGAFAAANHIAELCGEIKLVSVLGNRNNRENFARKHLSNNIKAKFFYRSDSETIVKKRFIEQYSGNKLFEICYMDKGNIPEKEEAKILKYLNLEIKKYDMVLALDFGHGLFTDDIIKLLEKKAKFLAINVQTNSANSGFNMITKYKKVDFGCITELEARLACHDEYGAIENVIKRLSKQIKASNMIMTRGNKGSMGCGRKAGFEYAPALSSRVVDRIGAGDAFFSFTAPCAAKKMPLDLISFVGNAAGAIAVQIVCNRKPVGANKLFEFLRSLLV